MMRGRGVHRWDLRILFHALRDGTGGGRISGGRLGLHLMGGAWHGRSQRCGFGTRNAFHCFVTGVISNIYKNTCEHM